MLVCMINMFAKHQQSGIFILSMLTTLCLNKAPQSFDSCRAFSDTLLVLTTAYLILLYLYFFLNLFIPMKPQHCESNNNWLWCHDWTCVLFLFSSSPWRGYSVRGLYRRAQLFLKNQCSNFRLRNRTWCCFCLKRKLKEKVCLFD